MPHGVLSLEKISAISDNIREKEEQQPFRESSDLGDYLIRPDFDRPAGAEALRLGLNQAADLGWG